MKVSDSNWCSNENSCTIDIYEEISGYLKVLVLEVIFFKKKIIFNVMVHQFQLWIPTFEQRIIFIYIYIPTLKISDKRGYFYILIISTWFLVINTPNKVSYQFIHKKFFLFLWFITGFLLVSKPSRNFAIW